MQTQTPSEKLDHLIGALAFEQKQQLADLK